MEVCLTLTHPAYPISLREAVSHNNFIYQELFIIVGYLWGCPERSLPCVFQRTAYQEALDLCQQERSLDLSSTMTVLTCVSCYIVHPEKEVLEVQSQVQSFPAGNGQVWKLCLVFQQLRFCLPCSVERARPDGSCKFEL